MHNCANTLLLMYFCKNFVLLQIFTFCHKFSLQGSGWKVVASFEGNFPNRIKQLPLDRHFDINNVKRVESLSYFILLFLTCNVFKFFAFDTAFQFFRLS
jgi:hypothetical protein